MAENKSPARLTKLAGAISGGGLLALLSIYLVLPERNEPAPAGMPLQAQGNTPERFGPGVWTDPAPPSMGTASSTTSDTDAPGGLATTADHRLVVNKALKDVADYFLLGGHGGTRAEHMERLLAHLRASLPSLAFGDAAKIVRNYLKYLDMHDSLLARASPPPATPDSILPSADIDRISTWIAQRARLRQDVLGMQVAQIWFGDEESADQQVLSAMRQRGGAPAAYSEQQEQSPSEHLQALREKNASYETQRAYVASHFGEQAAQRFDTIEGKEQAWKARYSTYRQTVETIRRQPGIDVSERTRLINALRAETFPVAPERLRAENLDALPQPNS